MNTVHYKCSSWLDSLTLTISTKYGHPIFWTRARHEVTVIPWLEFLAFIFPRLLESVLALDWPLANQLAGRILVQNDAPNGKYWWDYYAINKCGYLSISGRLFGHIACQMPEQKIIQVVFPPAWIPCSNTIADIYSTYHTWLLTRNNSNWWAGR